MIVGYVTKAPFEEFAISVTFARELAVGETIVSVVMESKNLATGVDSAALVLNGAFSNQTPVVVQPVKNGADGEKHAVTFKATTSATPAAKWQAVVIITAKADV